MTQPQPAHPQFRPQQMGMRAPAPPPPRRPSGGGALTLTAAILAVVAAGLAVGGLFGPIHSVSNGFDDGEQLFAYDLTWWGLNDTGSAGPVREGSTLGGLVLIGAAVLLVLAAVFVFLSGRSVRPGVKSAGRSLLSAGVGVLVGVAALQLVSSLDEMAVWNTEELDAGESLDFMIDIGLYLPLGAIVVGVVALVLAHRGQRPVRREPATPPMGFRRPQQYGPGPMTGQQPAIQTSGVGLFPPVQPGAGQGSGTFAPVTPPPAAPPTTPPATSPATPPAAPESPAGVSTVANGPSDAPLASRLDESTSDFLDDGSDADITQRVPAGPEGVAGAQPQAPPPAPAVAPSTPPPSAIPQALNTPPTAPAAPQSKLADALAAPAAPAPIKPADAPAPARPVDTPAQAKPADAPAAPTQAKPADGPAAPAQATPPAAPSAPAAPLAPVERADAPPAPTAPAKPATASAEQTDAPANTPTASAKPADATPAPSTAAPAPSTPEPAPLAPLNLPPAPPAPELAEDKDKKSD